MAAKPKRSKAKDAKPTKAAKRTKAAAAKTVEQRAASGVPRGTRLSPFDRVMQASFIGIRRAQKATWPTIAKEVGMSQRQCHALLKQQEAAQFSHSLGRDQDALIEWLLTELERDLTAYTLAAIASESDAGRVGALNGRGKTLERIQGLLQQTNRLPKDLGMMRHLHDLRVVSREIIALVVAIEQGKVERPAVQGYLAQLTDGIEPPPVEQEQVDEIARRAQAAIRN
ncbi:MAG: hypothetical protein LC798_13035 [Chloroflexi bacterium]|nr:hypothetical protein [Chloroflexota bacterium]